MLTFRTLFSGGELFGIGAVQAHWVHVDGFEIRADIASVARQNGFTVHVADVCAVEYESLPPVDHLHASPSCKNASQAKTNSSETEEDRDCADAVFRAIRAHTGRSFSLENVWGYRNFESFARILAALYESGFVVDFRHINAADFGVPQTRKRLILRAVRRSWRERVPPLHPTHREGGDMFHALWVGWYAAIRDIVETLPASQFALWQLARLPDLAESTIVEGTQGGGSNDYHLPVRNADEPIFTVRAAQTKGMPRAFIIGGGNTQTTQVDSKARWEDAPMFTVANDSALRSRAFLVDGITRPISRPSGRLMNQHSRLVPPEPQRTAPISSLAPSRQVAMA